MEIEMENNTVPLVSDELDVSITSTSSDWATGWSDIPKRFYVTVTDSNGTAVADKNVTLTTDNHDISFVVQNTPITNAAGVAECLVLLGGSASESFNVIADIGGSSNSSSNLSGVVSASSMRVELVDMELDGVKFPAALNGIIDDAVYDSGVLVANLIASNMQLGDSVKLIWGEAEISGSVPGDAGSFTFNLSGREDLFQNQTYRYRAYVADAAGNGRYTKVNTVIVERLNGGGGLPYLHAAIIDEGEEHGFINKTMADYGVIATIPGDDITYTDSTGKDVTIESPLSKATECRLILRGLNKQDVAVRLDEIDIDLTGYSSGDYKTNRGQISTDFFNTIGEGSVQVYYYLTLNNMSYSVSKSNMNTYVVDVVPPGI